MWKRVCRADEVPANGLKQFAVAEGPNVVIARAGEEFFAHQAFCPHQDVPLAEGVHDGKVLTCLEHMWQFDLRTGAPLGDAEAPSTAYPLKREADDVLIWLGEGPPK